MLPSAHIHNEWTFGDEEPKTNVKGNLKNKKSEFGENMGFISLLLHVKPFDYIKNERFKRHQIILGSGYSYVSYTMIRAEYRSAEVRSLDIMEYESRRFFYPYYGKVAYNYFLKNDLMIGMVGSFQGIKKNEAQFLLGFQFGVRF
jgi:hypothetical protein